jgi:SnoaL-like domain
MVDDRRLVPVPAPAEQLQWLVDRALIIETAYLYATAVDSRDFGLYRSIFTDEIDVDFSSYFSPGGGGGPGWVTLSADAWVDAVRGVFAPLDATQHSLSNPRVVIEGDRATCEIYVQADHFRANREGDNYHTVGGFYTHTLLRTAAGWRLNRIKLTVRWQRGNKHIMRAAGPVQGS